MSIECRYCERDARGPHDEDCPRNRVGDEIFERLREVGRGEYEHAIKVVRRLSDPASCAQVTDGELADAMFEFASRLDVFSPLLPVAVTMLERFMRLSGIEETPCGLKASHLTDSERGLEEHSGV